MAVDVELPNEPRTLWTLVQVPEKLALRRSLPGAFVFDHAAASLERSRVLGLDAEARITLAFASSWLVNAPATSRVLRAWRAPLAMAKWVDLVSRLEDAEGTRDELAIEVAARALFEGLVDPSLGTFDTLECVTKVLALVVPRRVPLLPPKARSFLLGPEAESRPTAETFCRVVRWFEETATLHARALEAFDASRDRTDGTPDAFAAQVIDRVLWFDSEGHRHWP